MSNARSLGCLLLASLAMLAPTCPSPPPARTEAVRALSTAPGSCDGLVDYGDEFEIASLALVAMRPVGPGVFEVELDVALRNRGAATFRAASMTPVFSAAPALEVATSPAPLAAEFGWIDPNATASSSVPLLFRVPALHYAELMRQLQDGTIPLSVYADEVNALALGVEIHEWSATEDLMYGLAADPAGGFGLPPNQDPGAGPFAPGAEFTIFFLHTLLDDVATLFDEFQPGELFYLVENPDGLSGGANENVPDAFDRLRVLDADRTDHPDDGYTLWIVTVKRTDEESLPAIYANASFCTDAVSTIDLPVHRSRLTSLDGGAVEPEASDASPQGIRFNDLSFGGGAITVSGQVQGHVLAPRLSLRIRDGLVSTQAEFDTDLSLTAELRAKTGNEVAIETVDLWSLCFPLPEFTAGPVSLAMNLRLAHTLGAEASFTAGTEVGFQKRFASGFTVTCESGGGALASCTSEGRRTETPIQFTPPRLTDDTAAHGRVETSIEASLNFFSPYPTCDLGPGLFTAVTASGTLDVTPTQDPWWQMEYGLTVSGGVDLDVLGLGLPRLEQEFLADVFDGPDSGVGGPRTSGEDQRWSVAIDATSETNGTNASKIAALPDGGSVVIASEPIVGRTPLVKLDRHGAMEWVQRFDAGKTPSRVRTLADGSVIVVGTNAWLARIGADGTLLWSFDAELSRPDYTFGRCALYDVAPLERSPGVYDYVAVGRMSNSLVTDNDACALRVDADGTLVWARYYPTPGVNVFYGAAAMRDGHVMAVGSDHWSWLGTRHVPLFVKLDPATGDPVFWKALPMTRLAELNAVAEASDGTLFAAGATGGIIYTTGTSLVAKMAPDGSEAWHAEVYQDESWEALLDFETWIDTAGGDTPYDAWFDIAPSGDGFVIVGDTGIGGPTAARVAKINAGLGTEWIATFDGAALDSLTGVAAAGDGIFVSGHSDSLPEPDGGSGENQLWVAKLPFTGRIDLLPEIGMTARFVAPAVRDSSLDPAVNPTESVVIDNPYTVAEAVVLSAGPNPGLVEPAPPYCVELLTATGHVTTADACADP